MTDPDRTLATRLISERWTPLVAHVVLFALLLLLIWNSAPHRLALVWGGVIGGISLLRAVVWAQLRGRQLPPPVITTTVRVTMLVLGLAWGLGGALVIRVVPIADAALVLLGLTGLLAGGLATLVADEWTFPLYCLTMFIPLVIVVGLVGPGLFDEIGVVLMIIFIGFTIRLHRQSYRALRDQLRTENELRDRERQLASAQAIAHVGSWEWDMETNVVTWSDELRRMYGLPPDAPAGYAEFLAVAHPDDRARLEAIVSEGVRTQRTIDYEWRAVSPGGELRHFHGRNVVIADPSGRAVRMAGTSLDITERKRAEENQQTLLRELQASVAQVRVLQGILPICSSCKRIKNESGGWEAAESFVRERTNAEFSHGLCPTCAARDWGDASPGAA